MTRSVFVNRKFVLAVAVLALAAAVVALVPVTASAQGHGWFGGPGKGAQSTDRDELLADALGIDAEALQAARQKAAENGIKKALDEGWIGQKQADLMSARLAIQPYLGQQKLMAEAFGMSEADLQKALEDGQSVRDLMEAKNLDAATVRDNLETAREKAVEQAVKDGAITAAQAELLDDQVGGPGGCLGHGGGRDMMGGFGDRGGRGMMNGFGGRGMHDVSGRGSSGGAMRIQRAVAVPSQGA